MRLISIFALVIPAILAFGIVSAGCEDSDQIIMGMSSSINAHAEVWNGVSEYGEDDNPGIKVCYDDYFDPPYEDGDAHACTGDNVLLKLSAETNAHAGSPDSDYPISVCHAGLSDCEVMEIGESCPDGKSRIAFLSDLTNAHVSQAIGNYPLCCKGEGIILPPITSPVACYELLTEEDCIAGQAIAYQDPTCDAPDPALCQCTWNSTAEFCDVSWTSLITEGDCSYKCTIETQAETECVQGERIVSLRARLVPVIGENCPIAQDPSCRSGSRTVPCGGGEIKLAFFGMWQFIISLVSIFGIYLAFRRDL